MSPFQLWSHSVLVTINHRIRNLLRNLAFGMKQCQSSFNFHQLQLLYIAFIDYDMRQRTG